MNNSLLYPPFILSAFIGFLIVSLITSMEQKIAFPLKCYLGCGLGLSISATLTFLSLILFHQMTPMFIIISNTLVCLILFYFYIQRKINLKQKVCNPKSTFNKEWVPFLLLCFLFIPIWIQAHFYPFGGWDAWSAWNLKAKFLFLGGDHWKNVFHPELWRSSPHYPLLLPLINVWGWIFLEEPTYKTPLMTSLLFTFLTAGLLFSGLKKITKSFFPLVTCLVILTMPFFVKLSISQYSDIVLGYYLLAAFLCLSIAKSEQSPSFALLSGIFIGLLSFTKSEGLVASLIVLGLSFPFLIWKEKEKKQKTILSFSLGACLGYLPSMIFYFFLAPENLTMINGLTSMTNPSTLSRLKIIFGFYFFELISQKWNGLWILLLGGLVLSKGRCFHHNIIIFPLFFIFYGSIITLYYYMNTYFEIGWWLQVSLNRLLYAILPSFLFWVFYSLWQETVRP